MNDKICEGFIPLLLIPYTPSASRGSKKHKGEEIEYRANASESQSSGNASRDVAIHDLPRNRKRKPSRFQNWQERANQL
jgi:hypothetical protein